MKAHVYYICLSQMKASLSEIMLKDPNMIVDRPVDSLKSFGDDFKGFDIPSYLMDLKDNNVIVF